MELSEIKVYEAGLVRPRTATRARAAWMTNPVSRAFILCLVSVGMISTRCAHTLLAQPFKMNLGVEGLRMPWFLCFITMASFPIPVLMWLFLSKGGPQLPSLSGSRMRAYLCLAILDALNTALGMIGLTALPAATFTIIKGSSIVFVVILSRMFTHKQFNRFHYIGVLLMTVGVALMSSTATKKASKTNSAADTFASVACCLGSAFFMAVLGVAQQALLGEEKKKGGLDVVLQFNAFHSTLCFVVLLPFIFLSEEYSQWTLYFESIRSSGHFPLFVGISVAFVFIRPLSVFCNMLVTATCSATAARALGAPRRVIITFLGWLIFNQPFGVAVQMSCFLVTLSFVVYVYGGVVLSRQKIRSTDSSAPSSPDKPT